jgi:monofunctional biosynthetic peptidoglycan transglycosylase
MAMRRRADPTAVEKRRYQPVSFSEMDPDISRAVLVAEDHRFMEHGGFDWIEVRKAVGYRRDSFAFGNAKDRRDLWRAIRAADLGEVRGASTITQQLARNLWLSPSRNPLRKVKEALAAKRLEWALPKTRILELYLNVAELGDGIWGVEAASQAYFGKSAKRLSLNEAATLAATLPHPRSSNYNFQSGRMNWKRNWILGRLGNRNAEPIRIPESRPLLPDIEMQPKVIRTDSTQ